MNATLFVLALTLFSTQGTSAQDTPSILLAPKPLVSTEQPRINLSCEGDDPDELGKRSVEAVQPIIQDGHAGSVTTIAFSPRSTLLATGSEDGTVKLWLVRTGQLLRTISVSSYWVHSLAFSTRGCMLAIGSGDHKIYVWNLDTGMQLTTLEPHAGAVKTLAFSTDGNLLASGTTGVGAKPLATIWEVGTWQESSHLSCSDELHDVVFLPGSTTLAISSGKRLLLWNYQSDRVEDDIEPHSGKSRRLFVAANGASLVSEGSEDHTRLFDSGIVHSFTASIVVWKVADGKLVLESAHRFPDFWGVGIGPDSDSIVALATGALTADSPTRPIGDLRMAVCSIRTTACRRISERTLTGVRIAALSASAEWLAFSTGQEINISDIARQVDRQIGSSHPLGVTALLFSYADNFLAVGRRGGQISVWDKTLRAPVVTSQNALDRADIAVRAFHFTPLTNTLFSASSGGGITRLDVSTLKYSHLVSTPELRGREDTILGTREEMGSVAASPPRGLMATIDGEGETKKEELHVTALASTGSIANGGFYSDIKEKIATGFVYVTDVLNQQPAPRIMDERRYGEEVVALSFSRDGNMLAIGFEGGGIDLWSSVEKKIVTRLDGHTGGINGLAFSSTGEYLASASSDKTVRIWNLRTGSPSQILKGHASSALCVSFSEEDEELLASGGIDNKIFLWNWKSGQPISVLAGHSSAVNTLAFVPHRQLLISGGEDATVRFWDTSGFQLLSTLLPVGDGSDYLATTPAGFFDGKEEAWGNVLWQFNGNLFDVSPVEVAFRDYFVPNLLSKALSGHPPASARSLAVLNRAQPTVRILSVTRDSPETVQVDIEVEVATSRTQRDEAGHPLQSGAYDLRVFRNRQLSGQYPMVPEEASVSSGQSLDDWRRLHAVPVQSDGKAIISFNHIRVPLHGETRVEFTSYAFNSDRIKSLNSVPFQFDVPTVHDSPKGRAYLIAMGVNANQSHHLDLELAVSSAERVRALMRSKLNTDYSEVVEIPLYSDLDADSNQVKSKTASKADLKTVLDLLAGRSVDVRLREEVDPKHELRATGPDDAVVLYVASHGYADPQGTFYLMPYDTGLNWGITEDVLTRCQSNPDGSSACRQARDLLGHSVSSADLTSWWSGVDAGEMLMILDSCHSGAVPGKEFRPGPLGDPGFGQLSYDKGMQILSASQPAQTEQGEWVTGGEGRTLLVDALEAVARAKPQHTLEGWLQDAEQELPFVAKQLYPSLKEEGVQRPVLLDFSHRRI